MLQRIVKCIETGNNRGCQGLRVGDNGKLLFNGYEVSVWEAEKSPGDVW